MSYSSLKWDFSSFLINPYIYYSATKKKLQILSYLLEFISTFKSSKFIKISILFLRNEKQLFYVLKGRSWNYFLPLHPALLFISSNLYFRFCLNWANFFVLFCLVNRLKKIQIATVSTKISFKLHGYPFRSLLYDQFNVQNRFRVDIQKYKSRCRCRIKTCIGESVKH